jgi:hypothetical protein
MPFSTSSPRALHASARLLLLIAAALLLALLGTARAGAAPVLLATPHGVHTINVPGAAAGDAVTPAADSAAVGAAAQRMYGPVATASSVRPVATASKVSKPSYSVTTIRKTIIKLDGDAALKLAARKALTSMTKAMSKSPRASQSGVELRNVLTIATKMARTGKITAARACRSSPRPSTATRTGGSAGAARAAARASRSPATS